MSRAQVAQLLAELGRPLFVPVPANRNARAALVVCPSCLGAGQLEVPSDAYGLAREFCGCGDCGGSGFVPGKGG